MDKDYESRIVNHALKTCGYYPLRAMQLWIVDIHFNKVNSTMLNLSMLAKIPAEMDLNRLAQAINDVLNTYDNFRCRLMFHPDTNDFCQRFDGEIVPVTVEKISDEELERRKEFLKKPYALMNKPLYRSYLFETPTAKYWYLDFYHVIMDGTSSSILFFHEVEIRYKGKNINRQPLNYADFILDELRVSPEELAAGNKYWRELCAEFDATKHLPPADIHGAQDWKSDNLSASIKNISRKYFHKTGRKETYFFLAASMLAIAKLTGAKNSLMGMVHNGRNTAQERRIMGPMIEEIPVSMHFENNLTVDELLAQLENNFNTGMKYRRSLGTVYGEGLQNDCVTFIFQKKIYTLTLAGHELEVIDLPENKWSATDNILDIDVNLTDDGDYLLSIDYDAGRYSAAAIENFAATFQKIVNKLQEENITVAELI